MAEATVYFATNRDVTGSLTEPVLANSLATQGSAYIRYGKATVATDGGYHLVKTAMYPEQIGAPAGVAPLLGSHTVYDELRSLMAADQRDVLVFIHGFDCPFKAAVEHAAELAAAYARPGNAMIACAFSWPSDGEMIPYLSYYRDEADAKASGDAIGRTLLKLAEFLRDLTRDQQCQRRIHLVAHSMGNYALRQAVQAMIAMYPGKTLPRLFDNIFMMAADEDADAFDTPLKLARLPELTAAAHVYYAGNDRALLLSDKTKRHPDRLGSTGPRTLSDLPLKVTLIDCHDVSAAGEAPETNHQYYRSRDEVLTDVAAVIAGKRPDAMPWRKYVPDKRSWRIEPA